MFAAINRGPDVYLEELKQELLSTCGVSVSVSTIWNTLTKAGYTMKKVCLCISPVIILLIIAQLTRVALERSAEKRAEFAARIGTYEPEQVVFVDESAVDRRATYRGRAWAIKGRKATRKAFFCRGRR